MNMKRLFQDENFLLKGGAQLVILSTLGLIVVTRGSLSMLRPPDLALLLLFNALIWCRRPLAADKPWLGVHLYLALQGVFACWLYSRDVNFGLFFFILYVQAILLARRRSRPVWIGLFLSALVAGNFYFHPQPEVLMTPVLTLWVFGTILAFVTLALFNQLRAKRKEKEIEDLLRELSRSHRHLRDYAEKVETLTAAEERNRISRELHDAIGHRLTASVVQIEGALHLMRQHKTQQAATMLGNVHEQLHEGLHELRDTLHALRTPKVTERNLTLMLQRLADGFTTPAHAAVHTRLPGALPPSLTGSQSMTVYRAVQETLTNSVKHAQARNIWIALENRGGSLVLTVRNDGLDFTPSDCGAGYGLQGMRERAAQFGAALDVTRPAQGGALVTLTLPLQTETERALSEDRLASELEEIAALYENRDGVEYA